MTIIETIEVVETTLTVDCLHCADGHALRASERCVYCRPSVRRPASCPKERRTRIADCAWGFSS